MRWFRNARLAHRLGFAFGILLVSMVVLAALGLEQHERDSGPPR